MKNKKKILSCISLLAFAALAAGFAGAGVRANAAETAGETQKANGFYMEAGASVRIDGKAGVRFQAYLSADKYAELIETPQQAGKDVKIYAVANRSDTGATLGATKRRAAGSIASLARRKRRLHLAGARYLRRTRRRIQSKRRRRWKFPHVTT